MQNLFRRIINQHRVYNISTTSIVIAVATLILVPYFIFNLGLVHEISKGFADVRGVPKSNEMDYWVRDTGYINNRDFSAAAWIGTSLTKRNIIYGDANSDTLLSFWFPWHVQRFSRFEDINKTAYIYLRTWNLKKNEILVADTKNKESMYVPLETMPMLVVSLSERNKVYDNNSAQIFSPK